MDDGHESQPGEEGEISSRDGKGVDVPPELGDAGRGIYDVRLDLEDLASSFFESCHDAIDSLCASVAQGVHVQPLGRLVLSQNSSDCFGDVFASPDFGLEHELLGVDGNEDDSRGGVETHVRPCVVVDVFWRCVHPGAK